ncbi:MAG: TatD family hydrolase [Gaiellaceae bacterium]
MIDAHAHLDACEPAAEELARRARAAGVETILSVGTDIESCRATIAIAERCAGVFAILGIHPHEAGGADAERLDELEALLASPRAVALGEIGLDYFRDRAPRSAQRALFTAQLELAERLATPVVIHTREADDDTPAALEGFSGTIVLHCFSSPALLPWALERDCFVSFAGNVTYPSAGELRDAARLVPPGRLLVETDCPYLAPQPERGHPNEPAFVVHTLAALADLRGEPVAELAERTAANTRTAFRLP